jgi:hypothetical protein
MFAGHFAVAFGGKRVAPAVSLGTLFMAAQFLDLLWPCFLLLGIEEVRITPGITAVTPFDFVSYPYSHSLVAAVGWSLLFGAVYWLVRHSLRGSVVLGAMLLAGVVIYGKSTAAKDRAGRYGFWGLVVFLLAAYLAALFGPVPPSVIALGWGGQSIWLLVAWGYWLDRHRAPIADSS